MIKVLWLTNKVLPDIEKYVNNTIKVVNEGWISQMFEQVLHDSKFSISIICGGGNQKKQGKLNLGNWYIISENRKDETFYSNDRTEEFVEILKYEKPDLIHIWGTEYPHTLSMVEAAKKIGMINRVVISLQGIISECGKKEIYYCSLTEKIAKKKTLFDCLRKTNIEDTRKRFEIRGNAEIQALSLAQNVIGRTSWDKQVVKNINTNINYYHCNETLRQTFYLSDRWSYENCKKESIFISQATYPLKGFHILLEAVAIIKDFYPNLCVMVAGDNITDRSTLEKKLKSSNYGNYIISLIKQKKLEKYICFLGKLSAEEMKAYYLDANVFISCSSLENSPNSVGEAMLMGTPIIASRVGGTESIISEKEGILYKWDDAPKLAKEIKNVFDNPEVAIKRGTAAIKRAEETHNAKENYKRLLEIYSKIIC